MKKIVYPILFVFLFFLVSPAIMAQQGPDICSNDTESCWSEGIILMQEVYDQKYNEPDTVYSLIWGTGQLADLEENPDTDLTSDEFNIKRAVYAGIDVFIYGSMDLTLDSYSTFPGYPDSTDEAVHQLATDAFLLDEEGNLREDVDITLVEGFLSDYFPDLEIESLSDDDDDEEETAEINVTACISETQSCYENSKELILAIYEQKLADPDMSYTLTLGEGRLVEVENLPNDLLSQDEINVRNAVFAGIDVFFYGSETLILDDFTSFPGYPDTDPDIAAYITMEALVTNEIGELRNDLTQAQIEQIGGFVIAYFMDDSYTRAELEAVSEAVGKFLMQLLGPENGSSETVSNIIQNAAMGCGNEDPNMIDSMIEGTMNGAEEACDEYNANNENEEEWNTFDSESEGESFMDDMTNFFTMAMQGGPAVLGAIMGMVGAMTNMFGSETAQEWGNNAANNAGLPPPDYPLPDSEGGGFSGLYDRPTMALVNQNSALLGGINTDIQTTSNLFITIFKWILGFVGMVGILFIIVGGYLYITAHGDDAQMEKAKKVITGAIIGLIVILLSYTTITTILGINGPPPEQTNNTQSVPGDPYANPPDSQGGML